MLGPGAESSHPPNPMIGLSMASPHPENSQEPTRSHFISISVGVVLGGLVLNNKRCPYHSGNSRSFGSSVPGTTEQDQIYFLLYHTRIARECLPSLLPPQLAVPYLRTLLSSKTADAFLFYILLYPLLTNHDCAANSPGSWFSGSKCRKDTVTFLGKHTDTN